MDYTPFRDLDKNGVIIVTLSESVIKDPNTIVLFNISGQFNGKGLRDVENHPELTVKFDFQNNTNDLLAPKSVAHVLNQIDRLYTNEIDALWIKNLPQMNYEVMAGEPLPDDAEVYQWDRNDLNRLAAHIRMLYDPTLTRQ